MSEELNIDPSLTQSALARPGATHYMDAPALRRGLRFPTRIKLIIAGIGAATLLITALFGIGAYQNVVNAPLKYSESINEAITQGPGLELPLLSNYVESDNVAIRAALNEAGYNLIDTEENSANEETDDDSLDLVKVPSDMDFAKSNELFSRSLRRASITDAAHFLAGMWRFTSYQHEGVDLKVKYASFGAATIDDAISDAITVQGWSDSNFTESGIDESENTFQSGTISINDVNYHWTVSACPLKEVYNISGLPDNSYYVGARLVQ